MTSQQWLLLALALLLLVLASVCETARRALSRISPSRAEKLTDEQIPGAHVLLRLVLTSARSGAALALLSTLARAVVVAVLVTVGLDVIGGASGVVVGTLLAVVALYLAADVVPAGAMGSSPERVAARLARVVRVPVVLLGPLAQLLARLGSVTPGDSEQQAAVVTEDQLRDLIEVAASDNAVSASKYAMLTAVFELDETVVREIMVPRPDVVSVSAQAPLDEVVKVMLQAGHSRVPVYGPDRDEITGVIYAKDVLALLHTGEVRPWTELMRAPQVVPELKTVDDLLRELQSQKVHLAVVVDEYGATVGLVTIEDILEELVGEIVDEYDHEVILIEQLDTHSWRVDARLPVDDLAALVDRRLPDDEWDTVGGLLFGMLGHIATPGERVAVDGIQLTAEQVRGRRISKVLVERRPEDQP